MGDFDRVQTPGAKPGETKKIVMVVALGAVLLGMLGFQMMKKGPGQASAAQVTPEGTEAAADIVPEQPTAELCAKLQVDPAAKFLQDGAGEPFPTAKMRNPFRMAVSFYNSIKPAEQAPTEVKPTTPVDITSTKPAPVPLPPPPPKGLQEGKYKLNMILVNGDKLSALINNVQVSAGSTLGEAYVVEIRDNTVVLRHRDFPDGPRTELSMKPNLNGGNR